MNTYRVSYKGRQHVVTAATTYEAQKLGASHFKAKRSWEVHVVLLALNGVLYVHSTSSL
jgi:hypothetical protein